MFHDKSAWFSCSVPETQHNYWMLEGGTVAGWRTADYLFSHDATCPDTLRIYESRDYLWNQVTVFHSLFLSACEKRQSVKSVCIGHYVLPPTSVQDKVRSKVGRLIWENEPSLTQELIHDESSEEEVIGSKCEPPDTESSESEDIPCGYLQDWPDRKTLTGYVSMDELQIYSGDLCDLHSECHHWSSC